MSSIAEAMAESLSPHFLPRLLDTLSIHYTRKRPGVQEDVSLGDR